MISRPYMIDNESFQYDKNFKLTDSLSVRINRSLPPELKRLIFRFIDHDTRIKMLLDKRPYLVTGSARLPTDVLNANKKNPFHSLLNSLNFAKMYQEGFVKQLFKYNTTSRRWFLKSALHNILPMRVVLTLQKSDALLLHANVRHINYEHPVHTILSTFRKSYQVVSRNNIREAKILCTHWSDESKVPVGALSLLVDTTTFDTTIDNYLRNFGFKFIIAIDYYIRMVTKKKFIKREAKREVVRQNEERYSMMGENELSRKYNKYMNRIEAKAVVVAKKALKAAQKEAEKVAAEVVAKALKATKAAEKVAAKAAKAAKVEEKAVKAAEKAAEKAAKAAKAAEKAEEKAAKAEEKALEKALKAEKVAAAKAAKAGRTPSVSLFMSALVAQGI